MVIFWCDLQYSCIVFLIITSFFFFFFFNDTATTEIYTLSLHDALPILIMFAVGAPAGDVRVMVSDADRWDAVEAELKATLRDRKSTRLNSSHLVISYAVFCLKKKKHTQTDSLLQATYADREECGVTHHL